MTLPNRKNRTGRPKSEKELRAAFQLRGEAYFREIDRIALNSKDENTRLRALSIALAYGWGKPVESIKIAGGVTVEERKRVILETRGSSAN